MSFCRISEFILNIPTRSALVSWIVHFLTEKFKCVMLDFTGFLCSDRNGTNRLC